MKRTKDNTSKTVAEKLQAKAAPTWKAAVSDVLTDVAKSAQKIVMDSTAVILHTLESSAKNWFRLGEELLKIANAVNERQFGRLVNEVFSRFGLSKSNIYRYMVNVEVLTKAVPYEPARDALLTVFNGQGLVSKPKGQDAGITGGVDAGFRKHPIPHTGTYQDCMDWAREVQLIAEKAEAANKQTIEEFFKGINNRFEKLLGKRYDLAVECVVICYRTLEAKSQLLAATALEAIEDSSITPSQAGKSALAAIKAAQQEHKTAA